MPATPTRTFRRRLNPAIAGATAALLALLLAVRSIDFFRFGDAVKGAVFVALALGAVWAGWVAAVRPRVVLHDDAMHLIGPFATRVVEYRHVRGVTVGASVEFEVRGGADVTATGFGRARIHNVVADPHGARLAEAVRERLPRATGERPLSGPLPERRIDWLPTATGAVLLLAVIAGFVL